MNTSLADPVSYAEQFWGIALKRVGRGEYAGPCPFCGDGVDRFHVWEDRGNYWCRVCGKKGFLDALENSTPLTPEQLIEIRVKALERKQAEHDRRLSALERMAHCTDHLTYHRNLTTEAWDYWMGEGITIDSISRYKLGYCKSCPADWQHRASYTIPIINGGVLVNIRHRLIGARGGGKYRPHMAGLGTQLFNRDVLDAPAEGRIVIVEGAKKAIVLTQSGFPATAVAGKNVFKREWLPLFDRFSEVVIALDPDAVESARRLAALFGGRGKVASFPTKPDDALVLYGAGAVDVEAVLEQARPVKGERK